VAVASSALCSGLRRSDWTARVWPGQVRRSGQPLASLTMFACLVASTARCRPACCILGMGGHFDFDTISIFDKKRSRSTFCAVDPIKCNKLVFASSLYILFWEVCYLSALITDRKSLQIETAKPTSRCRQSSAKSMEFNAAMRYNDILISRRDIGPSLSIQRAAWELAAVGVLHAGLALAVYCGWPVYRVPVQSGAWAVSVQFASTSTISRLAAYSSNIRSSDLLTVNVSGSWRLCVMIF